MKFTLLALFCALLSGCIEPPPATEIVTSSIPVNVRGCPEKVATINTARNDKVSWTLDKSSSGYPAVEAFGVAFKAYNPTYCVNEALVAKNEVITCTIKVDARLEPICYTVSTRTNGGMQTCEECFTLNVGERLPD
jgi:hypothetical protein